MSEQIPPGFTPEVWNQLTPQQKATFMAQGQQQAAPGAYPPGQPQGYPPGYPAGQGQPGQPGYPQGGYPQGMAGMGQNADMMGKMQKMTMISMAFGMLSSLVYSLTSFFRNR